MPKTQWFKLASRIACLAVLTSAALCLNAPVHADGFSCVLSANDKTGGMTMNACGTSGGDFYWNCPAGQGYCDSDPQMDTAASQACDSARANGCPEIIHFLN